MFLQYLDRRYKFANAFNSSKMRFPSPSSVYTPFVCVILHIIFSCVNFVQGNVAQVLVFSVFVQIEVLILLKSSIKTAGTRSPAFLLFFPSLVELRGIEPVLTGSDPLCLCGFWEMLFEVYPRFTPVYTSTSMLTENSTFTRIFLSGPLIRKNSSIY